MTPELITLLASRGFQSKDESCSSLKSNLVLNALYTKNTSIVEALMKTNKPIQQFFENTVKAKNPLLYACILNDMKTIDNILSTNTTLMNECILTVSKKIL